MRRADLVDRALRRARRNPIGAFILIAAPVFGAIAAIVGNWRTIFPPHLEVASVSVISDPDSVLAFRAKWLGDIRADAVVPAAVMRRLTADSEWPRGTGQFPIIDVKLWNPAPAAAFMTQLDLVARRRSSVGHGVAMCSATFPSWEYNIMLDTLPVQHFALAISQSIAGNGVDRFVLVVGHDVDRADVFDIDLMAHYNGHATLRLGTVTVILSPDPCTWGVHALPLRVRHIRVQ